MLLDGLPLLDEAVLGAGEAALHHVAHDRSAELGAEARSLADQGVRVALVDISGNMAAPIGRMQQLLAVTILFAINGHVLVVRAFVAGDTAEQIAALVQRHGAIAAPVVAPWSLLADPQHLHRGWMQTVDHPYVGTQIFPGFPWQVSPDAPSWDRPAALVGEHNGEIFGALGYSDDDLARLQADGVIGDRYGA